MTHDELLAKILEYDNSCNTAGSDKEVPKSSGWDCYELHAMAKALCAVVELHKPWQDTWPTSGNLRLRCGASDCTDGFTDYPCSTIQAIEKELI